VMQVAAVQEEAQAEKWSHFVPLRGIHCSLLLFPSAMSFACIVFAGLFHCGLECFPASEAVHIRMLSFV
jgi:hypothetical protein